ncbi:MAG: RNA polymerase sigma factor [Parcubacteria group bacterium]|nr:RNA polymerase sigma factor [Parcubacteria group bacterium]
MSTDITDENIAKRVQDGDAEAFGVLMDRYENKLTRYARKFLAGYDDREDALQNVFIKAYEHIQGYDAKRPFSPWIYRIAHNEFVNVLRRQKREPISPFDFDTLFPHPIAPEKSDTESIRNEDEETIDACIQEIDPKYREVLILYFYEELDYKTIADILHVPISTVGVRIKRGKEKLKVLCEMHHIDL